MQTKLLVILCGICICVPVACILAESTTHCIITSMYVRLFKQTLQVQHVFVSAQPRPPTLTVSLNTESDLDPDLESCEEINCQAAHRASAHQRVLLITTVDIGGGVFEQIEIMEEDDPLDITMQFCEDHSLPGSVLELLSEHILQTLHDTEMPPSPGWVRHGLHHAHNRWCMFF